MAAVVVAEYAVDQALSQGGQTVGNFLASQASTPEKAAEYKALGNNVVDTAALLSGARSVGRSLKGNNTRQTPHRGPQPYLSSAELAQLWQRVIQNREITLQETRLLGFIVISD